MVLMGAYFQDADWNVTSAVNYAAVPLDRVYTTPYGQPTFDTETINGDYDGDGDIDGADNFAFAGCAASAIIGREGVARPGRCAKYSATS